MFIAGFNGDWILRITKVPNDCENIEDFAIENCNFEQWEEVREISYFNEKFEYAEREEIWSKKELVKEALESHRYSLNSWDFEHYRDSINSEETEMKISDMIEDCDFENEDFNIGFEQGYIRGMENILSLLQSK